MSAYLQSEEKLQGWARNLGDALRPRIGPDRPGVLRVGLCGQLGAGKTTLARLLLRHLGHRGVVASPTFPLAQCYDMEPPAGMCWHLDLYRLEGPSDVEGLGLEEMLEPPASLWLVEWPERASPDQLPMDVWISLRLPQGRGQQPGQRQLCAWGLSARGRTCLEALAG